MVTVTSYTAERMKAIEDASVVGAEIVDGHLILQRYDESETDAGVITGNPLLDTLANLNANNPVVESGRLVVATTSDPRLFAIGDGVTTWANLPKYQGRVAVGWTNYTPTFKGTTTQPTLGTGGSIVGRYFRIGPITMFEIHLKWGSTGRVLGSGNYLFGLPFTSLPGLLIGYGLMHASALMIDASTSNVRTAQGRYFDPDPTTLFLSSPATWPSGTDSVMSPTIPWGWDVNDTIQIAGWFAHI